MTYRITLPCPTPGCTGTLHRSGLRRPIRCDACQDKRDECHPAQDALESDADAGIYTTAIPSIRRALDLS